jgi:hypothetical protein
VSKDYKFLMNTNEFYWPVSIKQIQRMGDDFNNNLFTKINKFKCEHKKDLVITIFAPLHNEILTLMTHLIVFNSKKKISYSNLFYSKKSRIAKSLIENRLPEKTYTENLLIKGFNENYFISIMKKLKSLIFNKYPTNSLKSVDLNNDIITIHTGDVIETHIKDKGQKVFYVPTNEWFKTLKKENNFYLENKKIIFLKNFIENQIFDLFNKYNVKSTNLINIYIKDLIFNLLKESNNYLGYIIENKIAPKILWTSSGGSLFTKIIRLSSKVCGGKVFGHDHSHGQGPFKNFVNSYIETNFLDEFYVRTAQQKYNLERELRGSRLKNEKLIIKISKNTQQKILKKKN